MGYNKIPPTNPQSQPKYTAMGKYRRDAVRKLEDMRAAHIERPTLPASIN